MLLNGTQVKLSGIGITLPLVPWAQVIPERSFADCGFVGDCVADL